MKEREVLFFYFVPDTTRNTRDGGARDYKLLVTHPMTDQRCLTSTIARRSARAAENLTFVWRNLAATEFFRTKVKFFWDLLFSDFDIWFIFDDDDGRCGVVVGILAYYARGRGFDSRTVQTFVCMRTCLFVLGLGLHLHLQKKMYRSMY
jgi:hypothetical protein